MVIKMKDPTMKKHFKSSYRKKIYDHYVETLTRYSCPKSIEKEYSFRRKIYEINYKALLPSDKEVKILELGCGAGYFLRYLKELGYNNVRGVDISPQQIAVAKKQGIEDLIIESDIFEFLNNTSDNFDMICAFHVLEHLYKEEILQLLSMIYIRLNKGGFLIIEVPNAGSPLFGSQNRYVDFTHEIGFTATSLKDVIYIAGFREINIFPLRGISPLARVFFRVINKFLHSRFTRDMFIEGELIAYAYKK